MIHILTRWPIPLRISRNLELTLMDCERDCLKPAHKLRQAIRNSEYYLDDKLRPFGRDILVEVQ